MSEPIQKLPRGDYDKLVRCDDKYRGGAFQKDIAAEEGCSLEALAKWLLRRGWKFELHRTKGPRVVHILDGSTLQAWIKAGDIAPEKELTHVRK